MNGQIFRKWVGGAVLLAAACLACGGPSWASPAAKVADGVTFEPPSNNALRGPSSNSTLEKSSVRRVRTFLRIKTPKAGVAHRANPSHTGVPPASGYYVETPASLECIYLIWPRPFGCDPNQVSTNSAGGSKMIAIVDATALQPPSIASSTMAAGSK